jgi:phosphoribosylformylglycinamidine cyclo-ligase
MYQNANTGRAYHDKIGIDTILMAVNDFIVTGGVAFGYTSEVASATDQWYEDELRGQELYDGYYLECETDGLAILGGESPALPLLLNSQGYVQDSPSFSGCVIGFYPPERRAVRPGRPMIGDTILGELSSGLHSNGSTLLVRRSAQLQDGFLTRLPSGTTFGEAVLVPTKSYVGLVNALLDADIDVHAFQPITGGGVGKIAFEKQPMTYRIQDWVEVPELFQFIEETLGISKKGMLETFNCGIGYVVFVDSDDKYEAIDAAAKAGRELVPLGKVEEGPRRVIFGPENDLELSAPA